MARTRAKVLPSRAIKILNHVIDYCLRHHGRYPTLRYLATVFNTSTSVINYHMVRLERFGYVGFYRRGKRKCFYVTGLTVDPPPGYPYEEKDEK